MIAIVQFVMQHGYSVLFAAVFMHQIGLPVPGPLFLLAAGALARNGNLGFANAICLAVDAGGYGADYHKLLSAMRYGFGGHLEKPADKSEAT